MKNLLGHFSLFMLVAVFAGQGCGSDDPPGPKTCPAGQTLNAEGECTADGGVDPFAGLDDATKAIVEGLVGAPNNDGTTGEKTWNEDATTQIVGSGAPTDDLTEWDGFDVSLSLLKTGTGDALEHRLKFSANSVPNPAEFGVVWPTDGYFKISGGNSTLASPTRFLGNEDTEPRVSAEMVSLDNDKLIIKFTVQAPPSGRTEGVVNAAWTFTFNAAQP